ncbi:MAG TPA: dihydrolipoamide acetyltransferase family protein [Rectinema sp.]|nr:dihydrolipoamide acetyltransferase family protein [Rectinema sp.]
MAIEILMPQLGLTMNEGTITEWVKKEGETVSKGDIVFYVENDKAVVPYEAQREGILGKILIQTGQTVPVGTPVGILAEKGEALEDIASLHIIKESIKEGIANEDNSKTQVVPDASAASASAEIESKAKLEIQKTIAQQASAIEPAGELGGLMAETFIPSSPYARTIAKEKAIDLAILKGSGPQGAIVAQDVIAASASSKAFATEPITQKYEDVKLSRIRQIAAERLTQSWTEIPQFTLSIEANAQGLIDAQSAFKSKEEKVSITVLLAKLMASALSDYPLLNASWLGNGEIRVYKHFNISIAIDSPDGLVVPTLRDCGNRGIRDLGQELVNLAEKARKRSLSPDEMQDGTITLSNLGMFGITRFRAIINPPQCAIISVGAITKRPAEGGHEGISFVPVIEIGLTADHRIVDGAYGARFLKRFRDLIEQPVLALG